MYCESCILVQKVDSLLHSGCYDGWYPREKSTDSLTKTKLYGEDFGIIYSGFVTLMYLPQGFHAPVLGRVNLGREEHIVSKFNNSKLFSNFGSSSSSRCIVHIICYAWLLSTQAELLHLDTFKGECDGLLTFSLFIK